jgi:integrase/recombinase XerD
MSSMALVPSPPRGRKTRELLLPFQPVILAGQLRASSIAVYSRDALAYCEWAKSRRKDPLKPATLGEWREYLATKMALSPHTINRMLAAVKRLMKEATTRDKLKPAIAEAFQEQKGIKVSVYRERLKPHARTRITQTDMRRITTLPDTTTPKGLRDAALLHTLASSGVRVSEAASLTIDQVEWRTVTIDE